jgi:hypothetical protein
VAGSCEHGNEPTGSKLVFYENHPIVQKAENVDAFSPCKIQTFRHKVLLSRISISKHLSFLCIIFVKCTNERVTGKSFLSVRLFWFPRPQKR